MYDAAAVGITDLLFLKFLFDIGAESCSIFNAAVLPDIY